MLQLKGLDLASKELMKPLNCTEGEARAYAGSSMKKSLAFGLLVLAVARPVNSLEQSMATGLAASFLAFFFLLRKPFSDRAGRDSELERELPVALRSLSVELKIGVPFEKALESVSSGGYGELSKEFREALNKVRNGLSVPQALSGISAKSGSLQVKRCVSHLVASYHYGKSKAADPADYLARLSKELVGLQKISLREHSGKMALYSLLFITVAALVPAMFQIMVLIGSSVFSLTFTPDQVFYAAALVFPSVDLLVMALMRSKAMQW